MTIERRRIFIPLLYPVSGADSTSLRGSPHDDAGSAVVRGLTMRSGCSMRVLLFRSWAVILPLVSVVAIACATGTELDEGVGGGIGSGGFGGAPGSTVTASSTGAATTGDASTGSAGTTSTSASSSGSASTSSSTTSTSASTSSASSSNAASSSSGGSSSSGQSSSSVTTGGSSSSGNQCPPGPPCDPADLQSLAFCAAWCNVCGASSACVNLMCTCL
jgi:hypothetical protein